MNPVGSIADFITRLQAVLPRWFPDLSASPVVNGLLNGMAYVLAQCYVLLAYVKLQTRIATATDGWLDLAAYDFFGSGLPRKPNEMDSAYRQRILAALFPERGTRNGMIKALTALTGTAPVIVEPARAADVFVLGYSGLGVGRLGSYQMNNQAFITVYRPQNSGGASIAGLGSGYAGLGSPYLALPSPDSLYGAIQNADIYATIEATRPVGSTMWTQILA